MNDLNLEALAEDIQQDRDTIVVPQDLVEELPPEKKISRNLAAEIQQMTVGERLKLALKGNRDARMILIRDSSRVVQRFVLQNPRITEEEVVALAKNRSIDRELLDQICRRKEWLGNYQIKLALATNPKTPLALAVRLVPSLLPRDLRGLAKSKNVPSAVNGLAKRLVIERSGGGSSSSSH
ncbi:hypothetical protein KF840_19605 [bacterium]|nr:hypothetical protein [bacterium]